MSPQTQEKTDDRLTADLREAGAAAREALKSERSELTFERIPLEAAGSNLARRC